VTEAVLDALLDTVFGWHERPGALMRLVPPWQLKRVLPEAGSLWDGRAVLGLLGGLRWLTQRRL
jgi:ligand-binding SRPBCC domain-containing protein